VVAAFLVAIAVGTLLLRAPWAHAPGVEHGWLTALFTATSAVCVTGLIVVDTGGAWSPLGQLTIALLIKAGGFGVLSLGALVALATGRRMGFTERQRLQTQANALTVGGIVRFVRRLFAFTMGTELLGTLLLWPAMARDEGIGPGAWSAWFHAVSAFNNAGFSLYPDSLARYAGDGWVTVVVASLFVLGGLGLAVVVELAYRFGRGPDGRRRARAPLTLHTRLALSTTFALALLGTAVVGAFEWHNPATLGGLPLADRPMAAAFQALTPRTAGFDTVDLAGYRPGTVLFTMLLMTVGGNPGSTAGGVKTTTFAVLLLAAWAAARGRQRVTAFGRTIDAATIMKAAVLTTMAIMVVGGATTAVLFTDASLPPLAVMFETASAFGTVGLSLGITGALSEGARGVLIALMLLGRVGLLTVALALVARDRPPTSRYPVEDVVVG
jgi:trk system potassium uptake protein